MAQCSYFLQVKLESGMAPIANWRKHGDAVSHSNGFNFHFFGGKYL